MTTAYCWVCMEIGTVAQWVAGISTFLAVLVALFKEDIVSNWRRPELDASITTKPPDCAKVIMTSVVQRTALTQMSTECYWLRIWVKNSGKTRAEKVQVFAAELSKRAADGTFRIIDGFVPMNLRWSHSQNPIEAPEIFAEGISPGMGKHCDLGYIIDPAHRSAIRIGEDLPGLPAGNTLVALELELKPNTLSHLIPPGTYRLLVRIAAANCRPVARTIEMTITGEWFSDEKRMLSEGIGIKVLTM